MGLEIPFVRIPDVEHTELPTLFSELGSWYSDLSDRIVHPQRTSGSLYLSYHTYQGTEFPGIDIKVRALLRGAKTILLGVLYITRDDGSDQTRKEPPEMV